MQTIKRNPTDITLKALAALFLFVPLILIFIKPPTIEGSVDPLLLVLLIMGPMVSIGFSVILYLKEQK